MRLEFEGDGPPAGPAVRAELESYRAAVTLSNVFALVGSAAVLILLGVVIYALVLPVMRGGDEPEQGWEALRQLVTGAGIVYPRAAYPGQPPTGEVTLAPFSAAKAHPTAIPAGEEVGTLGGIGFLSDSLPIVLHHHERFDGKGYPDGVAGEDIPIGARIFAAADAFDAMTADRHYRRALSLDEAMSELRRNSGSQFDPEIITVMDAVADELYARRRLE